MSKLDDKMAAMMGWTLSGIGHDGTRQWLWDTHFIEVADWHPSTDIKQAMECEAKVITEIPCADGDHYIFGLRHIATGCIASFAHPLSGGRNDQMFPTYHASDTCPARAICLAIEKVLAGEKN